MDGESSGQPVLRADSMCCQRAAICAQLSSGRNFSFGRLFSPIIRLHGRTTTSRPNDARSHATLVASLSSLCRPKRRMKRRPIQSPKWCRPALRMDSLWCPVCATPERESPVQVGAETVCGSDSERSRGPNWRIFHAKILTQFHNLALHFPSPRTLKRNCLAIRKSNAARRCFAANNKGKQLHARYAIVSH